MSSLHEVPGVGVGDVLVGKYRIDRILGAGGMGVVVAAHHVHLDERVAIKFLLPEMMKSGEAVARFTREARAAVKIKSEHVARVSDVGTLENGAPYMVMEYLEGGDLAAWLEQRGPLSIPQAVEFVLQACEAIAEAHTLGIIHRDLKPANLFVLRRPDGALSVKVLDFGISKMRGTSGSVPDASITKTQAMMGSPLYMSPEQMQSARDVDPRTDIWALGVILFELMTGRSPFTGDSMPKLVAQILSMPPPRLTSVLPGAPEGLALAIEKCLEKQAQNRFESIVELAQALAPFAPQRSRLSIERISGVMRGSAFTATATAFPAGSMPDATLADDALPTGGTQAAWGQTRSPRSKTAATLVIGGVVLALGAAAFLWLGPGGTPSTSPAAATVPPAPAAPAETAAPPKVTPASPASAVTPSAPMPEPSAPGGEASLVAPNPAKTAAPPRVSAPVRNRPAERARATPPPPASPPSPAVAPKTSPPAAPDAFDDRK